MNSFSRKTFYSFLCLPVRSIPIVILYHTNQFNSIISKLFLVIGLLFLWRSTTYIPKQKGFFGGNVWWQELRIFHGLCYLIVYKLMQRGKISLARKLLIVDLLVGMFKFLTVYSK